MVSKLGVKRMGTRSYEGQKQESGKEESFCHFYTGDSLDPASLFNAIGQFYLLQYCI